MQLAGISFWNRPDACTHTNTFTFHSASGDAERKLGLTAVLRARRESTASDGSESSHSSSTSAARTYLLQSVTAKLPTHSGSHKLTYTYIPGRFSLGTLIAELRESASTSTPTAPPAQPPSLPTNDRNNQLPPSSESITGQTINRPEGGNEGCCTIL